MYQIFYQQINIDSSLLFTFSSTSSTRGHSYELYKPFAHLKVCSDFLEYEQSTFGIVYHTILLMLLLYLFLRINLTKIGMTCYILIIVNVHSYI